MQAWAINCATDLRSELLVTPEVEVLPAGSFERTTFKAKRFVDMRESRV